MKNFKSILMALIMCFVSSNAFAFITVIDVTEVSGEVTTIQNPADYDFNNLEGKELAYRGQPNEAVTLFQEIAKLGLPQGLVEISTEINPATETVAVTVRVQGFIGWQYSYWILKKKSE